VIVRSHGANVTVRSIDPANWGMDPWTREGLVTPPGYGTDGTYGSTTWRDAYGLPAVLFCILVACRSGSQLPCEVYKPSGDGSEKAYDAPQRDLLHTRPMPGQSMTPRSMWFCLIGSMLGRGNGLIQKLEDRRGHVIGLQPVAANGFNIYRRSGRVTYVIGREEVDPSTLIHIVGDVLDDPEIGVSPLTYARETIGTKLAAHRFEGRYYATDGTPSEIIAFKDKPGKPARDEFRADWEGRHRPGTRRLGLLWGEATYQQIGVSLADAQYAESAKLTTLQASQILGMPYAMMNADVDKIPDSTDRRFRELFMQPLLTAIEQALHVDDQLFPNKTLFPRFLTNALLRPSLKDRADAYRLLRQGGILEANEIRALEDYPEHPDGEGLQVTPVGGAPNEPTTDEPTGEEPVGNVSA
jgi:HK97 family phage portal protein